MRAFHWIFLTLALGLVFGSASNALAEVYRWKDSNGVVHFGDRPVSTDPQVVKEVVVPRPNVSKAFQPQPSGQALGMHESGRDGTGNDTAADPSLAQGSNKKPKLDRGLAAQSQASCQAKVAAYRSSVACFSACGLNNRGNNSGRNNAGCGHCIDLPMPAC